MQAVISELWVYPIKSCQGHALSVATALETGLRYDRCMMVVSADGGKMVSQRGFPMMALIRPTIEEDTLTLCAPTMLTFTISMDANNGSKMVSVWGDSVSAIDMGDEIANWFSTALNASVRLVRFDPTQQRMIKKQLNEISKTHHQFADGYPYLVLSSASLRALNERLTASDSKAIPTNRFRPNIVINNVDEHTEDYAQTLIHPSGASFILHSPCTRCNVPTIDQATAIPSPDQQPTLALSAYRFDTEQGGVTFGMNALISQSCELRVGDRLEVNLKF
jgi:uncharacterized protein